jgi:hypothetical protein
VALPVGEPLKGVLLGMTVAEAEGSGVAVDRGEAVPVGVEVARGVWVDVGELGAWVLVELAVGDAEGLAL